MEFTREALTVLQGGVAEARSRQLKTLREARPVDKAPFDLQRFLELSFGEKYGRTAEQLEISYYEAFKSLKTMDEFVIAMSNYTY